jgi:hypothetical protein
MSGGVVSKEKRTPLCVCVSHVSCNCVHDGQFPALIKVLPDDGGLKVSKALRDLGVLQAIKERLEEGERDEHTLQQLPTSAATPSTPTQAVRSRAYRQRWRADHAPLLWRRLDMYAQHRTEVELGGHIGLGKPPLSRSKIGLHDLDTGARTRGEQ